LLFIGKWFSDASVELVAAFKQFAPPPHSENVGIIVEEKNLQ
jgi:hypothetical protein